MSLDFSHIDVGTVIVTIILGLNTFFWKAFFTRMNKVSDSVPKQANEIAALRKDVHELKKDVEELSRDYDHVITLSERVAVLEFANNIRSPEVNRDRRRVGQDKTL